RCVSGGHGKVRTVDAGIDLMVEIGLERGVRSRAGADGASGGVAGRDAAIAAVDDGVAGGITSVLVDDLEGIQPHREPDAPEEKHKENDSGEGKLQHR